MKRTNKGITLIALVITIIVLLILAAVSIATLTGENGILNQATNAKKKTQQTGIEESIQLAFTSSKIENYSSEEEKAQIMKKELEKRYGEGKVEVTPVENGYTIQIEGEETYNIYENGKVAKKLNREEMKVGDYIDYKPGKSAEKTYSVEKLQKYTGYKGSDANTEDLKQDDLNWRILRINDDGSMDLISDPTSQKVGFGGSLGYNNGVYMMNDICEKLYSDPEHGITARSVNIEDMEKWLKKSEKGEQAKAESISKQVSGLSGGTSYIESVDTATNRVTYKMYRYYPLLWKIEQDEKLKASDKYYKAYENLITTEGEGKSYYQEAKNLTVENTYYYIPINKDNYGDGASPLSNSNTYWVASRCIYVDSNYAHLGLCCANTNMNDNDMFNSNYYTISNDFRLRAVVTIGSDIQVTPSDSASNPEGTSHTINW